jgi:cell volume regulation protein A
VDTKSALKEVIIEEADPVIGKMIVDLHLPENVLIVLIHRDRKFIVPRGLTALQKDDKLLLLANTDDLQKARRLLKAI